VTHKLSKTDRIMKTIRHIPMGKVASYGQIADLAGLPGRARLVGKVLREADAELSLPWHRVLRSSGLLAFAKGTKQAIAQSELLQKEGVLISHCRVKLDHFGWRPSIETLMMLGF